MALAGCRRHSSLPALCPHPRTRCSSSAAVIAVRTSSDFGAWCPSASTAGRRNSCMRSSDSAGWRRASAVKVRERGTGQRRRKEEAWKRAVSGARAAAREAVWERLQGWHLDGVRSHSADTSVCLRSFQAACCCTNRTSLRSWDFAVSLVLTAPRPASAASPSNWMAAPGTSVARTVKASTCCGTAR